MNMLYLQTSRRLARAIMMRRYTTVSLSPVITHTLPSAVSYPSPTILNCNDDGGIKERQRKEGKWWQQ